MIDQSFNSQKNNPYHAITGIVSILDGKILKLHN